MDKRAANQDARAISAHYLGNPLHIIQKKELDRKPRQVLGNCRQFRRIMRRQLGLIRAAAHPPMRLGTEGRQDLLNATSTHTRKGIFPAAQRHRAFDRRCASATTMSAHLSSMEDHHGQVSYRHRATTPHDQVTAPAVIRLQWSFCSPATISVCVLMVV